MRYAYLISCCEWVRVEWASIATICPVLTFGKPRQLVRMQATAYQCYSDAWQVLSFDTMLISIVVVCGYHACVTKRRVCIKYAVLAKQGTGETTAWKIDFTHTNESRHGNAASSTRMCSARCVTWRKKLELE